MGLLLLVIFLDWKKIEKTFGPGLRVLLEPPTEEDPKQTLVYPLGKNRDGSNLFGGAIDGDGTSRVANASSCDAVAFGGRVVQSKREDLFLSFGRGRAISRRC